MHHQFSPRFNTSRVQYLKCFFFNLWEKTKSGLFREKCKQLRRPTVWGLNCANRWLTAQALLGGGEVGQMGHRRASRVELRKTLLFLWNLRALKWWLMLNCFMVRAWAKFIVLTFCLKVHAARPMGLISRGTGGRGIWSWRTRTAHERKIWPGWYFGQGERPAHRAHRGKRLRTPAL